MNKGTKMEARAQVPLVVKFWRSKHGLVKVLEITANLRQPSPTPNIQSRAANHRGGCVWVLLW